MTQLALLLALSLIGSVLSYGFGRLEVRRVAISSTLQRAEGAIERAALAFWRLGALRGLLLLAAPAVGLAGFGLLGEARAGVSGLGRAAFLLLALVLGAASALLQARVTLSLGARGAAAAASSVARGSARALRPLIRAAAAGAIFGESLGLLGVSAAFAALYAVRGGFAAGPFPVSRFVLFSSRDSVGGGPYIVEEAYPLARPGPRVEGANDGRAALRG